MDSARADRRAWTTTESQANVGDTLVLMFWGRPPSAADAAALLEKTERFTVECATIKYVNGGSSEVLPASGRTNQVLYPIAHDGYEAQQEILTIKDEWFIEVSIHGDDSARPGLRTEVADTLLTQSLR